MESLVLRSRRRILERPRLLRALDRSNATLKTIVASAGYGKSTLAEQWAAVPGRRVGWYRARTSASDVSVVARGLVEAASAVVPGAGGRLLERLAVTSDPDREAVILAEMLAIDLQGWPADAWIVVDDYHLVQAAPDPETFVETLIRNCPVRMLLVGRNRPRWVTSRDVLYGEVLEIGRAALAMNQDEIDEMLGEDSESLAAGLMALADGWPAVVALSTATTLSDLPQNTDVPEELFDFFAEEVFRLLPSATQRGLLALAGLPLIDIQVAARLLGTRTAVEVIETAADAGLVASLDGRYTLHPLAASFFKREISRAGDTKKRSAQIRLVFDLYAERGEWDAAFDLALSTESAGLFEDLLRLGGRQLVNTGRLSTLEHWVEAAAKTRLNTAALRVLEAELAVRHGRSTTALTLIREDLNSVPSDPDLALTVLTTGARALHIASREEEALREFDRASAFATTREAHRRVLEGRLGCAAALELPVAHEILEELRQMTDLGSPFELIRLADRTLSVGLRFGNNRRREVADFAELVSKVDDPFARLSFLCLWGWANVLSCRYEHALDIAEACLDEVINYRIEVGAPYARIVRAAALAGLRRYPEALREVNDAHRAAEGISDMSGIQNVYALKVRVLLASGARDDACALEPPDLDGAIPFVAGEVNASRALALVTTGRLVEGLELASRAASMSSGVETRVLVACVRALHVLRSRTSSSTDALRSLLDEGFDADAPDAVVTAYRSNPELLAALADSEISRDRFHYLLGRAGDLNLAKALGVGGLAGAGRVSHESLSTREREVFELVCDGLSNAEIAKRLFIAESTVKAHVHRIMDKVGIRSRAALAIEAAMQRYAASADTTADSSS